MIPLALILKFAPYAAAGAAAVALAAFTPIIGFNAQRHRLEHARDTFRDSAIAWHDRADGWKASFTKSETFRKADQAEAVKSVEATEAQCNVRVAEARRSAEAIKRIVERPVKVDAGGCPVRVVVSTDDLRDALGAR